MDIYPKSTNMLNGDKFLAKSKHHALFKSMLGECTSPYYLVRVLHLI